jgi:hypothetical protein
MAAQIAMPDQSTKIAMDVSMKILRETSTLMAQSR